MMSSTSSRVRRNFARTKQIGHSAALQTVSRLAMDGVLPDGTKLPFAPRDRGQGFNSILRTTHRQNFLVPPRRNRSFPLVELLT